MKKPRLTEADRLRIEEGLRKGMTAYVIAKDLKRPVRTIMREIRLRARASDKGAAYRVSNRCVHRMDCQKRHICAHGFYDGSRHCGDFVEDVCARLSQPPYVCNGCPQESKCVLRKRFYQSRRLLHRQREDRLPLCQWRAPPHEAPRPAARLHAQAPQNEVCRTQSRCQVPDRTHLRGLSVLHCAEPWTAGHGD